MQKSPEGHDHPPATDQLPPFAAMTAEASAPQRGVCIVRYTSKSGPSRSEYSNLADAFDVFNERLFGGRLPPVLITLNHKAHSVRGYFHEGRFLERGVEETVAQHLSEISLNPKSMAGRSDEEILSTLVHEMAHHWQSAFGNPSRPGYHNREWAEKMEEIGLVPSNTGCVGGRKTGQQMTHYIASGGVFEVHCRQLLGTGWKLHWHVPGGPRGLGGPSALGSLSKTKFTCPVCGQKAWAKPTAVLKCGVCDKGML